MDWKIHKQKTNSGSTNHASIQWFMEMSRRNSFILSTVHRHAMPFKHAKLIPTAKKRPKKKKKSIWASPGWLKVVLSNGCFVAHINLDSSNIQTDRQRDKQPSDIINMKKSHWISANFFKIWNNFAFQFHYLWIICINRNYFNHWHCLLPLKHRQNCLQSTECWPF